MLPATLAAQEPQTAQQPQATQEAQQPREALRDTTSTRIEEVVVTARGRNRARKYFRRYVRKVPLQGWYVGFTGAYRIEVNSLPSWRSRGEYERNHIPGDDANRGKIDLFKLRPAVAADSTNSWLIRRYILQASSIAERAAMLGHRPDATMSYRGLDDQGRNTFLISEPGTDKQRGFDTRILVNDTTGLIVRSESVSRSPGGVWNVAVDYSLFDDLIYPTRVAARLEQIDPVSEKNQTIEIEMTDITPRRFAREVVNEKYWKVGNDPSKVLKKKVRDRLLKMK